jgi:hypothetical protein
MNPTSCLFGSRFAQNPVFLSAHFYLMKKSAKELLYFGLDCGMMKFFTFKPQPKEQFISFPHFWGTVR